MQAGASACLSRIAVWVYACNPERGPEPGAEWAFVRVLAGLADLVVFHGSADTEDRKLRRWAAEHAEATVEFVLVTEPCWVGIIHRWFRFDHQLEFITDRRDHPTDQR